MDKTFSIVTMGCKLNQFDSEELREALIRRGWRHRRFGEEDARVFIINSCTVTGRSDARCRNAVRRTRRLAPDGFVVVTGCFAETQREALEGMREVDLVLGNGEKRSLPALLDRLADRGRAAPSGASGLVLETEEPAPIERFLDHSRAFVKVQDGCNASCSYCIVPRARGRSRSVPADEVLRQIGVLAANGYREIVLTGIHIGRYGADLDPPRTLASLLRAIFDRTEIPRVRLGSVEPTEVTPELLTLLGETDRLAPHLHIPLQSGDDDVLAAMNRPYRAVEFRDRIADVLRARPGAAIGSDIIVGFPGETEAQFARTFSLVRDCGINYVHVFSFSPRPLTSAASMGGAVSPVAKKSRSARVIALGDAKWRSFLASQVGTVQPALVEERQRSRAARVRALTGTYCEVHIAPGTAQPGSLVPVRIERLVHATLHGAAVATRAGAARDAGGSDG